MSEHLNDAYVALQAGLASGWNTWDVRSVLSHVLLPDGLCVRLGVKEYTTGKFLGEALAGRPGVDVEVVRPCVRTYDGSFTELELKWLGISLRVETSADAQGLVIQISPLESEDQRSQRRAPLLVVSAAFLWNRPGTVRSAEGELIAERVSASAIVVNCDGEVEPDHNVPVQGPYLAVRLGEMPVTISVGVRRDARTARTILDTRRAAMISHLARLNGASEETAAVQSALAWDTIYDPDGDRVVSPVSRVWSSDQGGWVLFCWDTYFAGLLAGLTGHRELAYANVVEITRHALEAGFVPNTTNGHGFVTRDRSQPPVGSIVLMQLFRLFGDRWLLEWLFEPLLKWNRWWHKARRAGDNCLAWGSNPYEPVVGNEYEFPKMGVGGRFGGALESGMDNSPAYDDVPYDAATCTLALQDVGLTSLYIADCEALAEIAGVLNRPDAVHELAERASRYREGLASLWSPELGIFANRSTQTGAFGVRFTPANFYPLLVRDFVTAVQAEQMLVHLNDPTEFGGLWMLPSVTRRDPAYPEQHYWRGRIWPPHVYLVWLGLQRSGLHAAAEKLAQNGAALLLKEWRSHGHVHENYHGDTGDGCGYRWSDPHYHWGGLLAAPVLHDKTPMPMRESVTR